MRRWLVVAGAAMLLALLAGPAMAAGKAVSIASGSGGFGFAPATLKVAVGDSVTWTNNTGAPHTVTSNSGSELGSSAIDPGATFSHTFSTAGTFRYHCSIHPSMTGTIVVAAASAGGGGGGATPRPSAGLPNSATVPGVTAPDQPPAPTVGGPSWPLIAGLAALALAVMAVRLRRARAAGAAADD